MEDKNDETNYNNLKLIEGLCLTTWEHLYIDLYIIKFKIEKKLKILLRGSILKLFYMCKKIM